jgi:DNA-binding NtrC family response regulator
VADLPCILIVEDNQLLGQALVSHLARLDAFAVLAADIPEAIGLLEQVEFDLVIADCRLPHGTGHDVLAFVERRFPGMPSFLMSGDDLHAAPTIADVHHKRFLVEELPSLVERARGDEVRLRTSMQTYATPGD